MDIRKPKKANIKTLKMQKSRYFGIVVEDDLFEEDQLPNPSTPSL